MVVLLVEILTVGLGSVTAGPLMVISKVQEAGKVAPALEPLT